MYTKFKYCILLFILIYQSGCKKEEDTESAINSEETTSSTRLQIPVYYYKLNNGLKVILSKDDTSPTAAVAVYYNIGFRNEPRDRTGFAHLFEHMMFQGSQNLGKMEFIKLVQNNGGTMNGSTRFDFTNYYEVVPAHKLETILWAEGDRMKGLAITQDNLTNQQGVVKNEVKVNVLNRPYGGFPWLDMPQYANENWYNAHNFYGDLKDLDAATLTDVQQFFDTFYVPNNAALSVVGNFDIEEVKEWIQKYFGTIEATELPAIPDISEKRQEESKAFTKDDPLANKPAIAVAYHMPERNSTEYYAMGLLDQILTQGNNALLTLKLEKEKGYTSDVSGGINYLGNMFNYNGPMQWMYDFVYDTETSKEEVLQSIDEVMSGLPEKINEQTTANAKIKFKSQFYEILGRTGGLGIADLLCAFALFDDDPSRINEIEAKFEDITPEQIKKAAAEYLRPENRTILHVNPLLTNTKNQKS